MASVYDCTIIPLQKTSAQGGFSVNVNNQKEIPFEVKRVYYLYEVPKGQQRGEHAHKELQQLIIAVRGSFSVTLDDGENSKTIILNRPDHGLLVRAGIWRRMKDFSPKSLCLALASQEYDEADYIRDYREFLKIIISSKLKFVEYDINFLSLSWDWLNDPEIKILTDTPAFTKESQKAWFNKLSLRTDYRVWGIVFEKNKIGVVGLKNITSTDAEFFGYIGDKVYWNKGISKYMLEFVCKICRQKDLKEIRLTVIKENRRAIRAYEKFGFKVLHSDDPMRLIMKKHIK